ncbi:hypothetical protein [Massilia soli]|nr:hypothetical protein [Massilia soli]
MSSSRRSAASEDNILASLERGSSSGTRAHRSWLIIGGSMAALLTLMIAWLAYSNATSVRALPASAVKREAPAPLDDGMRGQAVPSFSIPAPQAAMIVDEPAVAAPAKPALVMLPRDDIAKPEEQPPVAAQPPQERVSPALPAARVAPIRSAAAPRQAAKASKVPAAKPVPRVAAAKKTKTPTQAPQSGAPEVDSDVALISAILAHSTRHAAERAQLEKEACVGKKCAPKPLTEP